MFIFLRLAAGLLFMGTMLFAVAYVQMNHSTVSSEPTKRSANTLQLSQASLYLSILAAVLSCLLNMEVPMADAIVYTNELLFVFSCVLLLAWTVASGTLLYYLMKKRGREKAFEFALQKIQGAAMKGLFLTAVLAWMFS